jgi:hypothetical protein
MGCNGRLLTFAHLIVLAWMKTFHQKHEQNIGMMEVQLSSLQLPAPKYMLRTVGILCETKFYAHADTSLLQPVIVER